MCKTLIIAEAGVNHNGDFGRALEMITIAKSSKADAIKFQTAVPEEVATKSAQKADYQKEKTRNSKTQLEMIKEIHLPLEQYKLLKKECDLVGIEFLSSPFDLTSVNFLANLGMSKFKVPSGEITNFPYLKLIGEQRKPTILSTGMANMNEIKEAVKVLLDSGLSKQDLTIMHCTTEYPTPIEEVNLNAMLGIKEEFQVAIG